MKQILTVVLPNMHILTNFLNKKNNMYNYFKKIININLSKINNYG